MNAISVALANDLQSALQKAGSDPAVSVIVVSGAGGNFCAGGDVEEVERLRAEGPEQLRTLFEAFRRACETVATIDIPVVAAVQGVAMAGGFELMQAADIALVRSDAKIADSHINFGMVPGGGSSQRLPRLVGRQIATALLLSGDRLSGLEAVRLGLAYRSYPPTEFDDGVSTFAKKLASRDRVAVSTIKRLVGAASRRSLDDGLRDEIDAVVAHICGRGVDEFAKVGGGPMRPTALAAPRPSQKGTHG
ncbi:MAG: enoyl-CoA hydratase [Mycobacterium sp.]|nr:MAG: enoyl-CoA hydratase [Mycobacterium sp.]